MHYLVNCNYMQYYKKTLLSNRRCCNLSFSYSDVMVYVLNTDNCCYLLSSFVLLDDVNMTLFAFVYSSLLIMVFRKEDKILIKKRCGNWNVTVRKGLLRNFWTITGTEGDWIICWRNCVRRALWNGRLVAAGDVHRADAHYAEHWCCWRPASRNTVLPFLRLVASKQSRSQSSWLRNLGCHAVSCIPDKNNNSHHRRTEAAADWSAASNSRLSPWLLISGNEDRAYVCKRRTLRRYFFNLLIVLILSTISHLMCYVLFKCCIVE